ncbi:facilitated trehalose transporter Tret1-like isoform X1 [Diorhabda sublineata]|uniref:facilitated trehalose transporter Tret1-like isoform X1 n=2 Tax=Diorhabda sublineata TaxID=1163346 RepID=UPI0024E0D172|nr:facilitated trehalose transporter Tret1-like isoform X1 [Diorhabda sublineata]
MTNINIDNTNSVETKYIPKDGKNFIELVPENVVRRSDTLYLYFVVIIGVIPSFTIGACTGWLSPVMVKLQSNDTSVNPLARPITTFEVSLCFAVPGILSIIGTSILPKIGDIFGRKKSMMCFCIGLFLSIIGLAFSKNITVMILFHTFIGIFLCAYYNLAPIYLTEICENHNRGKFGCLFTFFVPIGELASFIIGPMISYTIFTLLTAIPLIPFSLFLLAPESPVYLLTKGENQRCMKSLKQLRNNKTEEELISDFNEISKTLILDDKMKEASLVRLFSTKECRLGLILGSLPSLVQIFCGVPIIMSLLAPIFNQSGSNLSGETIAIIVALIKTVSFGFTSFVVEKYGRRKLLIASSLGMGSAISVLSIFFYLNSIKSLFILQFKWVPLVGVLVYIVSYSIGVGTLPLVIIGELFVSELRTSAFAFIMAVSGVLYTIYSASYPLAAEMIGVHWCMGIFGFASFTGGLLIYLFLPETKGRSILEIQNLLKHYN